MPCSLRGTARGTPGGGRRSVWRDERMPLLPYLRDYRERRGFTIRELAAAADVATATIVRVEHGSAARSDTAWSLADALRVTVSELMVGEPLPVRPRPDAP